MKTLLSSGVLLGLLFAGATRAQAQGIGGIGGIGGLGGPNPGGLGGICGLGGCLGGLGGMCGLGGCIGGISGPNPGFGGICGLCGGLGGCCGGMMGMQQPTQFYSDWARFPGRSYYHRSYHLLTPNFGMGASSPVQLVVIHYPDRPHYFYYYDPQQKKYVGRYRPEANDKECFAVLPPAKRKRSLAEIPEAAYGTWGHMPTLAALSVATFPSQIQRPPTGLPGHNLPPDEPLDK